jgi:hypothetical protein
MIHLADRGEAAYPDMISSRSARRQGSIVSATKTMEYLVELRGYAAAVPESRKTMIQVPVGVRAASWSSGTRGVKEIGGFS